MILDIFKDSFAYAAQDIKALLKLGLCSFLNFLIIPGFLIMGYEYRVIKTAINGMIDGDDKLPKFNNLISMFVDGVKYFIVQFVYLIIPIIIGFAISYLGEISNNSYLSGFGMAVTIILLIISIFYSFLAIPNMISNDESIKEGFNIKRLNEVIRNIGIKSYVGFYIAVLIINLVIYLVISGILMVFAYLFGITTFLVFQPISSTVFYIFIILFNLVMVFLVTPYVYIFTGRAQGLIYGIGE